MKCDGVCEQLDETDPPIVGYQTGYWMSSHCWYSRHNKQVTADEGVPVKLPASLSLLYSSDDYKIDTE